MSTVYATSPVDVVTPFGGLKKVLGEFDLEGMFKNKIVAIKVHMGERGNRTHLHPSYTRALVRILRDAGAKPFVTDTTTLYNGPRSTGVGYLEVAAENGFTLSSVGAPIIIADGIWGEDGVNIRIEGCRFEDSLIGRILYEAEGFIVLSHCKGHLTSGFGGAVKNVAMGFAAKKLKAFMHKVNQPRLNLETCNGCGFCVKACGFNAITLSNGKAKINYDRCVGCGSCIASCPTGSLTMSMELLEEFNKRLGECCGGILEALKGKPFIFVNVAEKITKLCDCVSGLNELIAKDSGIFASQDPVALDHASIVEIEKNLLGFKNLKEVNNVDPKIHLKAAEKFGVGKLNFTLKRV